MGGSLAFLFFVRVLVGCFCGPLLCIGTGYRCGVAVASESVESKFGIFEHDGFNYRDCRFCYELQHLISEVEAVLTVGLRKVPPFV